MFSDTRPSLLGKSESEGQWSYQTRDTKAQNPMARHAPDPHLLGDGVFSSLDLAEELLGDAVVEGELPVQHGEEDHAQGPHVTGFPTIRPACKQRETALES